MRRIYHILDRQYNYASVKDTFDRNWFYYNKDPATDPVFVKKDYSAEEKRIRSIMVILFAILRKV